MKLDHTNGKRISDLQTVIAGRLGDFARELTTMIGTVKFGRLQFTGDEYKAMETASRDLAKLSNNIADEVKALGKRRTPAVVAEGQKLLSRAESTKVELMKSQKPCRQVIFIRNIQLFFNPPQVSKLDSPAVQKRKQLTRERCERLKSLAPNKIILWAVAFAPSVWDSNVLQKSTFDFIVEFLEPGDPLLQWPAHIFDILNTLASEQPLCDSSDFRNFLAGRYGDIYLSVWQLIESRHAPYCCDGPKRRSFELSRRTDFATRSSWCRR